MRERLDVLFLSTQLNLNFVVALLQCMLCKVLLFAGLAVKISVSFASLRVGKASYNIRGGILAVQLCGQTPWRERSKMTRVMVLRQPIIKDISNSLLLLPSNRIIRLLHQLSNRIIIIMMNILTKTTIMEPCRPRLIS